jgi:hypothetical protein
VSAPHDSKATSKAADKSVRPTLFKNNVKGGGQECPSHTIQKQRQRRRTGVSVPHDSKATSKAADKSVRPTRFKSNVKGGGQECPPHMIQKQRQRRRTRVSAPHVGGSIHSHG